MGDNKCAYDGCNALEFRKSGYCLRHKGPKTIIISEINPMKKEISENTDMINTPNPKYNNVVWFIIGLFAQAGISSNYGSNIRNFIRDRRGRNFTIFTLYNITINLHN